MRVEQFPVWGLHHHLIKSDLSVTRWERQAPSQFLSCSVCIGNMTRKLLSVLANTDCWSAQVSPAGFVSQACKNSEHFLPVYIIWATSREVAGWRVDLCGRGRIGGQDLGLIGALVQGGVELWFLKVFAVVWSRCCHWLPRHLGTIKSISQKRSVRKMMNPLMLSALDFGEFT